LSASIGLLYDTLLTQQNAQIAPEPHNRTNSAKIVAMP
jgi:hypothetical protein